MPSTDCNIFILSGKIHSGKSRTLGRFLTDKKSEGKVVRGLLNPSIDSEKWFIDLISDEVFSAEKLTEADTPIVVGNYQFSTNAFDRAKAVISETLEGPCDFFVIDELGKLEMKGEGLEPSISVFLENIQTTEIKNIIIVVRDYLVEKAMTKFQLQSATVINQKDLFSTKWN